MGNHELAVFDLLKDFISPSNHNVWAGKGLKSKPIYFKAIQDALKHAIESKSMVLIHEAQGILFSHSMVTVEFVEGVYTSLAKTKEYKHRIFPLIEKLLRASANNAELEKVYKDQNYKFVVSNLVQNINDWFQKILSSQEQNLQLELLHSSISILWTRGDNGTAIPFLQCVGHTPQESKGIVVEQKVKGAVPPSKFTI